MIGKICFANLQVTAIPSFTYAVKDGILKKLKKKVRSKEGKGNKKKRKEKKKQQLKMKWKQN